MQRHETEVDNLDSGPKNVVGLQRGDVDVLELFSDCSLAPSFRDSHEGEKQAQTCSCVSREISLSLHDEYLGDGRTNGGHDQLIKSHSLQSRNGRYTLGHGEDFGQELKPLKLNGSHQETEAHETCQTLKVKGWGKVTPVRNNLARRIRVLAIELMNLNGDSVILRIGPSRFPGRF